VHKLIGWLLRVVGVGVGPYGVVIGCSHQDGSVVLVLVLPKMMIVDRAWRRSYNMIPHLRNRSTTT